MQARWTERGGWRGSGFLAFLLLTCAQLLSDGSISFQVDGAKFVRYMVIAGVAGAYSGLSARAFMQRFIRQTGDGLEKGVQEGA